MKIITRETVREDFKKHDERVITMLEYIVQDLQQQYKVIPEYVMVTLELLSTQFDIYFRAKDLLEKQPDEALKANVSNYTGTSKPVEVMLMSGAHDKIFNIMKEIGMTSMSKKKLDKLASLIKGDDDENFEEEFLND